MAPSATEQVTQVAEHIKQKVVTGQQEDSGADSKQDTPQSSNELPDLLTGHREPLKLSGALNKFEQFDVTPTIGREYANVDLAEWIQADNSDELLRDLAITGEHVSSVVHLRHDYSVESDNLLQSLNVV